MGNFGFGLVEVIVVMGITVILTAMSIGYNRTTEQRIVLASEQAKIAGMIDRAKALTLQKYREGGGEICGFGVYFKTDSDPDAAFIFGDSDNPLLGGGCEGYDEDDVKIGAIETLDRRVSVQGRGSYVLFRAPYLEVQSSTGLPFGVLLKAASGDEAEVEVSSGGAVSLK